MGAKLGLFRAVYIVCVSSLGAFAFAFDTGVISELGLRVLLANSLTVMNRWCLDIGFLPEGFPLHYCSEN